MHGAVAEGVLTSRSAYTLSRRLGVEVPIIEGIWRVIHGEGLLQICHAVVKSYYSTVGMSSMSVGEGDLAMCM
jgi:glycerol-3-phosphate dehydrogenase